jgi:hypothetical protein
MAELLVIGPLANLGIYLIQWACKKRKAKAENKEHNHESKELMNSIDSLVEFVQERAGYIRQLQRDLEMRSGSLGISHYEMILSDRTLGERNLSSSSGSGNDPGQQETGCCNEEASY